MYEYLSANFTKNIQNFHNENKLYHSVFRGDVKKNENEHKSTVNKNKVSVTILSRYNNRIAQALTNLLSN